MTAGSLQLRLYRRARRAGYDVHKASQVSEIGLGEARLIEAEDAKAPPPAEAYLLTPGMARRYVGYELADTPLGIAAISGMTGE